MSTPTVCGLSWTPVKGTRLHRAQCLQLTPGGVADDRRFYVVDERARMLNGKVVGELSAVVATWEHDGVLGLSFPDGGEVEGRPREGSPIQTRFYRRPREDRLVEGPFARALSAYLGREVALVQATTLGHAVDRGVRGGVSLISRASLARLAAAAGSDEVDARRFRMTIEIDGVAAHAEDRWVGSQMRIGSTRVAFHGHVGRCLVTSRHPDSGVVDLPTLDLLAGYRGTARATEPLPFGVYGQVLGGGPVRLGDSVIAAMEKR